MRTSILLLILSCVLISCKRREALPPQVEAFDVTYAVTFTGKWASPRFGVPAGVHFTELVGAVHAPDTLLWEAGAPASRAVQLVAEDGVSTELLQQVDALLASGSARQAINRPAPPPDGPDSFQLRLSRKHSAVSVITMLAPTPDWFTGISAFPLYRGHRWVRDTTLFLFAYDAGTKEGNAFSYDFPPTVPRGTVQQHTVSSATPLAGGNAVLHPIAELRFQLQ
ncbi:spondin domain-containing protein [Flaviaesturariibacter amylovorans]